jgi:hypothetical protein
MQRGPLLHNLIKLKFKKVYKTNLQIPFLIQQGYHIGNINFKLFDIYQLPSFLTETLRTRKKCLAAIKASLFAKGPLAELVRWLE